MQSQFSHGEDVICGGLTVKCQLLLIVMWQFPLRRKCLPSESFRQRQPGKSTSDHIRSSRRSLFIPHLTSHIASTIRHNSELSQALIPDDHYINRQRTPLTRGHPCQQPRCVATKRMSNTPPKRGAMQNARCTASQASRPC